MPQTIFIREVAQQEQIFSPCDLPSLTRRELFLSLGITRRVHSKHKVYHPPYLNFPSRTTTRDLSSSPLSYPSAPDHLNSTKPRPCLQQQLQYHRGPVTVSAWPSTAFRLAEPNPQPPPFETTHIDSTTSVGQYIKLRNNEPTHVDVDVVDALVRYNSNSGDNNTSRFTNTLIHVERVVCF